MIRRARPEDIAEVLGTLRQADYDEVVASTGYSPERLALAVPFNTRVGLLKDVPVALFGCSLDAEGAHPWLLCSKGLRGKGLARYMIDYGCSQMRRWYKMHGRLTNVVFTRNHAHLRFVQAVGCTLGVTTRRGPLNQHFTEFYYVPSSTRRSAGSPRLGG